MTWLGTSKRSSNGDGSQKAKKAKGGDAEGESAEGASRDSGRAGTTMSSVLGLGWVACLHLRLSLPPRLNFILSQMRGTAH